MIKFFIIFTFIFFINENCRAEYSSPPFNYGIKITNPAALGFMYKKFILNVNYFSSQDAVQDETNTIDGGSVIKNQISYKKSGEKIMSALKFKKWGIQAFYGPREESKTIPLKNKNTYYMGKGTDMRFHLGHRWSQSFSFGLNYYKWSDDISEGSTDGGSEFLSYKENVTKMGGGIVYRFSNIIFFGAGVNKVDSDGDLYTELTWQESYFSGSYVQAFNSFVARLELSYLLTPEAKAKATSSKNLNHHSQSKDLVISGEVKFNKLIPYTDTFFVDFRYSSKTETGLNDGTDKKTNNIRAGIAFGLRQFILGANLEDISSEEGLRKEKYSTLEFYLTYGI